MSNLPEMCYGINESGDLIVIKNGEPGHFECSLSTDDKETNRVLALRFNEKLGVSLAEYTAMMVGSAFGWNVPAVDPELYKDIFKEKKYEDFINN